MQGTTIFLDRDGVINENRSDYVKSWSEFCFLPGSKEAIVRMTRAGYQLFVCTNQAGIARGRLSIQTVEHIHAHMTAEIALAGGKIEHVYYCPHASEENCMCRKPRPGMLLRARDEMGINLHTAIVVGDAISDIAAGLSAGVYASVLVLTGRGQEQLLHHAHETSGPFLVAASLQEIAASMPNLYTWINSTKQTIDPLP